MSQPFTLRDARGTTEASTRPDRLAFKNADGDASVVGQMLALDESEGIVTAIVSVTGVEDEVQDIIVPGAYKSTLSRRRPKVCWAHSWERPVGRVLHIEELSPGDERLPVKTKEGKAWPTEGGALVATMQFNMASEAGREAFEAVKFYSETGECEYSIGYQVPAGKSVRDKAGVRHIKALELYELSVVLFGAHTMTGTLSIKDAYQTVVEAKAKGRTATAALAAVQTKDVGPTPASVAPDYREGVMVAVYPDPAAADRIAVAIEGPDDVIPREELHVTLAYLGNTYDVGMSEQEIVDAVTMACAGENVISGVVGGIGMFPADDEGNAPTWAPVDVPGLTMLRETICDALGDDTASDAHGFTPHITLGYNIGLIDPLPEIPVTFSTVKVVYGQQTFDVDLGTVLPDEGKALSADERRKAPTMPGDGDRFQIRNIADLDKAVQAYGRAKDKPAAKRWIIRRARELGALAHLPDSWSVTKGYDPGYDTDTLDVETRALLMDEVKATTPGGRQGDDSPVGKPGGRQNWVDKAGGLPKYIRMVAHALMRNGHSESSAIQIAVATIKKWARGGGKVSPKVQAAAAAALGEWEKMKAGKAAFYDPSLDGMRAPEVKSYPTLPGSVEERQDAIRSAVCEALTDNYQEGDGDGGASKPAADTHVSIEATFPDRVIATKMTYGPTDDRESFEIPYTYDDGVVTLGEPVPVELQIVAVATDTGEDVPDVPIGDTMPLVEDIGRIMFALKSAMATETKAGRVLSAANEQQLRVAVGNLLAVLAAAGVRVEGTLDTPDDELPGRIAPNSRRRSFTSPSATSAGDRRIEVDQAVDLTTTSPSATTKSADAPVTVDRATLDATILALFDPTE